MGSHVHERGTYPPLNTLKPVAESLWIVDGPIIGFGVAGIKFPFPTRMSIIRLDDGGLFIHSPTPLTDDLRAEIDRVGPVRHVIAPNRIHYWWVPDWHKAYPEARIWLAPRIREQAGSHIDFETETITGQAGYPWDDEIATLPIAGSFMTEVEFFHRRGRTLILTDFIENFEPEKLGWILRLLTGLAGIRAPDGAMPRDMRLTFRRQKPELKAAIEKMISWQPERVIIAHGRWYERDGAGELRRAFGWLL